MDGVLLCFQLVEDWCLLSTFCPQSLFILWHVLPSLKEYILSLINIWLIFFGDLGREDIKSIGDHGDIYADRLNGLGIMSLRNLQRALRTKLLWNAVTSNSMWAKYFRAKHLKQNHISEANFCSIHSASKLDWIRARELLLQHYKFIVNNGCSKFWWDTWIGDCPLKSFLSPAVWRRLQNKHTTVREVLQNRDNSAWRPIRCHLPAEIREALEVMPIPSKQEADKLIWKPTADGNFSSSSARRILSSSDRSFQVLKKIWSSAIQKKISFFICFLKEPRY